MNPLLRVATYNCHLFEDTVLRPVIYRDEEREKTIDAFFLKSECDIVGLCEVWSNKVKKRMASAASEILRHSYWVNSSFLAVGDGLVVMSRFPLSDSGFTPFKHLQGFDRDSQKGIIKTVVEAPSGKFRLFYTHTQADDDKTAVRETNLRQLVDEVASFHIGLPALIMGDLNVPGQGQPGAGTEYDTLMHLFPGFTDCYRMLHPYPDPGCSYDVERNTLARRFDPGAVSGRYDYILASQGLTGVSCTLFYDLTLSDGTPCSDHFPLLADVGQLA